MFSTRSLAAAPTVTGSATLLLGCVLFAATACSSSDGGTAADAGADGPRGETGSEVAGAATLVGTITDQLADPVVGAHVVVEASGVSGYTDAQGKYNLPGLPVGSPIMIQVTNPWFQSWQGNMTLVAGTNTQDWQLHEVALEVTPEDRALAEAYQSGAGSNWKTQSLSIAVVSRPTRRDFDNAVYFRNPALYRDRSAEPALAPAPAPEIAAGAARNFTFPLTSGARQGQEALELSSIADAPDGTALGATEPAEFMMWTPLMNWLAEGDAARSAELRAVGVAVRQQTWGSNALRPQEIDKVFIDGTGALWAKVVFASFVQLGPGVADDDGDGLKEIYARIPAAAAPADLVERLRSVYGGKQFTTHGLSKELGRSLNELYSTTMAQVERTIGQPFVIPGAGTVMHPFVVLKHAGDKRNVILVGPSP